MQPLTTPDLFRCHERISASKISVPHFDALTGGSVRSTRTLCNLCAGKINRQRNWQTEWQIIVQLRVTDKLADKLESDCHLHAHHHAHSLCFNLYVPSTTPISHFILKWFILSTPLLIDYQLNRGAVTLVQREILEELRKDNFMCGSGIQRKGSYLLRIVYNCSKYHETRPGCSSTI